MTSAYHYPETLTSAVASIHDSLRTSLVFPSIEPIISTQNTTTTTMAKHLESLASHYEQMESALNVCEAGEELSKEDLREMYRDTDELPAIMAELDDNVNLIQASHDKLITAKDAVQEQLNTSSRILDNLDELGEIMSDMLEKQQEIEEDFEDLLDCLQQRLLVVEDLYHRYVSFQSSFSKLLVEIGRRRQYREAAERIVDGMMAQLEAMTEEERQVREEFNTEHGAHIPTDLCLCIENPPTRWEVVPWPGDVRETLPEIDSDLLAQAREKLSTMDITFPGTDSV